MEAEVEHRHLDVEDGDGWVSLHQQAESRTNVQSTVR